MIDILTIIQEYFTRYFTDYFLQCLSFEMERSQEDFLDFQTQESQKVKETFEGKKNPRKGWNEG